MNTNRLLVLLCMVALFASGCSDSSDTASVIAQTDSVTTGSDNENTPVNDAGNASANNTDSAVPDPVDSSANNSNTDVAESTDATATGVDFNITVPAYKSNALLVRVEWGDKTLNTNWNVDELWTVSDEFPTNVENRLVVSFFDQNGAMILGRYEADLATGKTASQDVTVPDSLSEAVGYFKATTDNPNGFGWQVALSADGNTMATIRSRGWW